MTKDQAEVYCNTMHYKCVICGQNYSRDDVREIKDGEFTKFVCDFCNSREVNWDVHGEGLWKFMMSPVKSLAVGHKKK